MDTITIELESLPSVRRLLEPGPLGSFSQRYADSVAEVNTSIQAAVTKIDEAAASIVPTTATATDEISGGPEGQSDFETILHYAVSDIRNLSSLVMSTMNTYKDVASMVDALEAGGFSAPYVEHCRQEIVGQSSFFNSVISELHYYMSLTVDVVIRDVKALQQGDVNDATKEAMTQALRVTYQNLLGRSQHMSKVLDERIDYVTEKTNALRRDIAKLQVAQMEDSVRVRRQAVAEKKQQQIIEDIKDYEDLEGQYRHHYDEEGNLVGTDEGGKATNRQGIRIMVIALALVAIALIVHHFFTI